MADRPKIALVSSHGGHLTELLELACSDSQTLRARIEARGPLAGEHEFLFPASAAIPVKE